jgi:hypothetical protein
MNTFFNILQTVINSKTKTYPDEPFSINANYLHSTQTENTIYFLIGTIHHNYSCSVFTKEAKRRINAKFAALSSYLDNSFTKKELKEIALDNFCKAQRIYYAFMRLTHIYKLKKSRCLVNSDLSLNPLVMEHNNTFILMEEKSMTSYLFSLNDLLNIIETAIGNAPDFFMEPAWPLNPYNNQPFTVAVLYNVYFKMKSAHRLISVLFHYFFLEGFDLKKFSEHYEPIIRETAIQKYVFNSHYTTIYDDILTMLKSNIYTKLLYIHKSFPKDVLADVFRPFLYYYYIVNYDIEGTIKIQRYRRNLFHKLKSFYEFNNLFGRKFVKVTKQGNKFINTITYNTKHISFYNIIVEETSVNPYIEYAFSIVSPRNNTTVDAESSSTASSTASSPSPAPFDDELSNTDESDAADSVS